MRRSSNSGFKNWPPLRFEPLTKAPAPLLAPAPGPTPVGGGPRRYGRRTSAQRISTSLWPDVFARVTAHAEKQQLTLSGAVHDILRRYFKLPIEH